MAESTLVTLDEEAEVKTDSGLIRIVPIWKYLQMAETQP